MSSGLKVINISVNNMNLYRGHLVSYSARAIIAIAFIATIVSSCVRQTSTNRNDNKVEEKTYQWEKTAEGYWVWVPSWKEYSYSWSGEAWNSVIDGPGNISVIDANGSLVCSENITAFFGAIDSAGIVKTSEGWYVGERSNGNVSGFGIYAKQREIYYGDFVDGYPDGYLLWYVDGNLRYQGYWSKGEYHGEGIRYYEDSISEGIWEYGNLKTKMVDVASEVGEYHGYIVDGKPGIRGTLNYADGSVYSGEWANGKWCGEGIYSSDHDSIAGEWGNNKLNGFAQYMAFDFTYEGDFVNGVPDGHGQVMFPDSSYYNGSWSNGKKTGYGDLVLSTGDCYFGEWTDNAFDGFGKYIFADGSTYSGQWKSGLQHGEGTYKTKGFKYVGEWDEGWMNGEGKAYYRNGDYYEGGFVENQRYGVGLYHFKNNGNEYEGEFVDDKFNGLGVFKFSDGSVYEGEFEDGKIKGEGSYYCVVDGDSVCVTGYWPGNGKLPAEASILFSNGMLYEGAISGGKMSASGSLYKVDKQNSTASKLEKANEWYKKNHDKIDKVLNWVSIGLTVIEIIPSPLSPIAAGLNIAINAADAAIRMGSAAVDGDWTGVGTEVLTNVAFIALPKVLKNPARKASAILSNSAKKASKALIGKITKGKAFQQIVYLTKDERGRLTKKLMTSKTSVFLHRLTGKSSHQFVSRKTYKKAIGRNPSKLKELRLGQEANGATLRHNMEVMMGKTAKGRIVKEGKRSYLHGAKRAQAHHIIPGNSPNAQRARDIMKRCGMDINDPRNGIMLPQHPNSIFKGSLHGNHTKSYEAEVVRRLEDMVKKKGYSESALEEVLDGIKKDLYKGNLPLLSPNRHMANKTRNSYRRRK